MHRALRFTVVVTLLAAPSHAAKRGLIPQDFYKEARVNEVAISPAGDLVAFTVMTIDEKDNKRHREIWMQPLQDGRPKGDPFRSTAPT